MDVLRAFGAAVRNRRQQLGWSQEELADRCGLHRTYIGGIERGERNVSLRNVDLIARTLEADASSLLQQISNSGKPSRT